MFFTDKKQILKQLLPGLIPIIVYIIADSVFGEFWGMLIAASLSIIEFIYIKIFKKVNDNFVLFDLLLVIVFGTISLISENPLFFKLKPAILELFLAILIAIAVFIKTDILEKFILRYLPNIKLNNAQFSQIKKSTTSLFYLICIHIIAVIYTALFQTKAVWAFVSSIGLYILFGIWFLFELYTKKIKEKSLKNEEYLDIVDLQGNKIGEAPRSICHTDKSLIHQVIHLHIINSKNELLLQKRKLSRQIQPGKWDTSVGGHILRGETIKDALFREAFEEVGINNFEPKLAARYIWQTEIETELVNTFVTFLDFTPEFDIEEIEEIKFWKINDIAKQIGKGIFTPNFEEEFMNIISKIFK